MLYRRLTPRIPSSQRARWRFIPPKEPPSVENVSEDVYFYVVTLQWWRIQSNKNAVTIARDQKNNMGLEEVEYGGTNQIAKMIQRYDLDQKKTYYVRG